MEKEEKIEYQKFNLEKKDAEEILARAGLGEVETISRCEEGMINDVYSINGAYVLKVNSAHPLMPKLDREAAVYRAVGAYNIPVPKLYVNETNKDLLGYPYILLEQLPGKSLKKEWKELSQTQKEEMMLTLGQLLGTIHTIGPEQISLDDQSFNGSLRENIDTRIIKIGADLRSSKVLDALMIDRIERYYRESNAFESNDVSPSLLHGNYVFGNIMISDGDVQGIVDWEWARLGYSEEELANVLYRGPGPTSTMGIMDTGLLQKFREGYESAQPLSKEFEERYLPYALLYYLSILPSAPQWTHKPEKQKEYFDETHSLIEQIGL